MRPPGGDDDRGDHGQRARQPRNHRGGQPAHQGRDLVVGDQQVAAGKERQRGDDGDRCGPPAGSRTGPVLRRTYLEPAPVQKQAAGALGLSWGSYRRHLTEGIAQVVELLWQRELD